MVLYCRAQVLLALMRAHLDHKIGRQNIRVDIADAIGQATYLVEGRRTEAV